MTAFIGYASALEFWRKVDGLGRYETTRSLPQSGFSAGRHLCSAIPDEFDLIRARIGERPVHTIVPEQSERSKAQHVKCHVHSNLPERSFVRVSPSLCVSTPEALVVQLARTWSVPELVMLIDELCGSYSLNAGDMRGFVKRDFLMTKESLRKYLDRAQEARGAARAARALSFSVEGAASPMESLLVALLCLPGVFGGLGFPLPEMNHRVDVPQRGLGVSDRSYFVCDLFWGEASLAVEYDSDMFHTGSERLTRDARRRNALEALGVRVIQVTRDQVFNEREFERVSMIVGRALGRYRGPKVRDFAMRQRNLRKALFEYRGDSLPVS